MPSRLCAAQARCQETQPETLQSIPVPARLPDGCFKALKYKATPKLTKHPKAPLLHTTQTPAPQEAIPHGHGDEEREDPGSRGHEEAGEDDVSIGDLESILKGIQVPPGLFAFNKQIDKGSRCPNYIC